MAVDPQRARDLALALPDTSEVPHFHRRAFRTPRKMFATLDEKGGDEKGGDERGGDEGGSDARGADINLLFDPDLRDFYCALAPDAFAPVPGGWGRKGATRCDLAVVDEPTLLSALQAAHRLASAKPRRR